MKNIVALILNILILILEIIGFILCIDTQGVSMFQFYTQDSNILAFFASLFFIIFYIKNIITKNNTFPRWFKVLKYMATSSVALTFLVVIFVLTPMMPKVGFLNLLFLGSMLYHHTLCPILAIISFIFFENCEPKGRRDAFYAIFFTIIYAIITIILNIAKVLKGPYPFLYVYEQPIYMSCVWCIVIVGGSYLISFGIGSLNRKINKIKK